MPCACPIQILSTAPPPAAVPPRAWPRAPPTHGLRTSRRARRRRSRTPVAAGSTGRSLRRLRRVRERHAQHAEDAFLDRNLVVAREPVRRRMSGTSTVSCWKVRGEPGPKPASPGVSCEYNSSSSAIRSATRVASRGDVDLSCLDDQVEGGVIGTERLQRLLKDIGRRLGQPGARQGLNERGQLAGSRVHRLSIACDMPKARLRAGPSADCQALLLNATWPTIAVGAACPQVSGRPH